MSLTDYEKYHLHDHVYEKSDVDTKIETVKTNLTNMIANKKQVICIYAEENGPFTSGKFEWSFGNGTENQSNYGYCLPVSGRVKYASISAVANGPPAGEIRVNLVINGIENTNYQIMKPNNYWREKITFQI